MVIFYAECVPTPIPEKINREQRQMHLKTTLVILARERNRKLRVIVVSPYYGIYDFARYK